MVLHCAELQPKLKAGLSENCIRACACAKTTVLALCERARIGQVSINELEVIGNANQIIQLFQASSTIDKEKLVVLTALKSVVEDRNQEYNIFLQHHTRLKHLFRHIAIKVEGN